MFDFDYMLMGACILEKRQILIITPTKIWTKYNFQKTHTSKLKLCLISDLQPTFMMKIYFWYHSVNTTTKKNLFYYQMPKSSDNQWFFINESKNWKVLSLFLELKDFIFTLLIEILEDFIFALLLDSHVQVVKSEKVLSLLFNLESFIFVFSINILEVSSLHYYWTIIYS